jgi:tetraacyldisaccharide 4'-kinase
MIKTFLSNALTRAWERKGLVSGVLWPLSLITKVWLLQTLYPSRKNKDHALKVPLVIVGNVLAGGVGKTPVLMALVEHLKAQGIQVGVIAKPYRAQNTSSKDVSLVIGPSSQAADVGDEPLLIWSKCQVPVVVSQYRVQAAQTLLDLFPATQVILSDDGLQHPGLHADMVVCVFDQRGLGNERLLPSGPLREPWPPQNVNQPMWVINTTLSPKMQGQTAKKMLSKRVINERGEIRNLSDFIDLQSKCCAVAGTAQPDGFFSMLAEIGLRQLQTLSLPDHASLEHYRSRLPQGKIILCTEKDAVKLWPHFEQVWAVPLNIELDPDFLNSFDQTLAKKLAQDAKQTA